MTPTDITSYKLNLHERLDRGKDGQPVRASEIFTTSSSHWRKLKYTPSDQPGSADSSRSNYISKDLKQAGWIRKSVALVKGIRPSAKRAGPFKRTTLFLPGTRQMTVVRQGRQGRRAQVTRLLNLLLNALEETRAKINLKRLTP